VGDRFHRKEVVVEFIHKGTQKEYWISLSLFCASFVRRDIGTRIHSSINGLRCYIFVSGF
jgi:hypothetical protein